MSTPFPRDTPWYFARKYMSIPRHDLRGGVLFFSILNDLVVITIRTYKCINISRKSAESWRSLGAAPFGRHPSYLAVSVASTTNLVRTQHVHHFRRPPQKHKLLKDYHGDWTRHHAIPPMTTFTLRPSPLLPCCFRCIDDKSRPDVTRSPLSSTATKT